MSKVKDGGIVTAYGAAVRGGYVGTYQQFCAALGQLAEVLEEFEGFSVEVTTLNPGAPATADYNDGVLTLGIPRGETGNGIQSAVLNSNYTLTLTWTNGEHTTVGPIRGAVGATPNLTIGNVQTLQPSQPATATITGTPEDPVLNFGIPKGESGGGDAGDITFDPEEDYDEGTVGAELSSQKNAINDLDKDIYYRENTLVYDTSAKITTAKKFFSGDTGAIASSTSSAAQMNSYVLPSNAVYILGVKLLSTQHYCFYSCSTFEECSASTAIGGVQTISANMKIAVPENAHYVIFDDNGSTVSRRHALKLLKSVTEVTCKTLEEDPTQVVSVAGKLITYYSIDATTGVVSKSTSAGAKMVTVDVKNGVSVDMTGSYGYAFFATDDLDNMNELTILGSYTTHSYDPQGDNTVDVPDNAITLVLNLSAATALAVTKQYAVLSVNQNFAAMIVECLKNVAWVNGQGTSWLKKLSFVSGLTDIGSMANGSGHLYDSCGILATYDNSYASPQLSQYHGYAVTAETMQGGIYYGGYLYQFQNNMKMSLIKLDTMAVTATYTMPSGYATHFNAVDWIVPGEKAVCCEGNNAYFYDFSDLTNISAEILTLGTTYDFNNVAIDTTNKILYAMQYEDVSSTRSHIGVYAFDLTSYMTDGTLSAELTDSFQVTARHVQDSTFIGGKIVNGIDRVVGSNSGDYTVFGVQVIDPSAKTETVKNVPLLNYYECELCAKVETDTESYLILSYAQSYRYGYFYKIIV